MFGIIQVSKKLIYLFSWNWISNNFSKWKVENKFFKNDVITKGGFQNHDTWWQGGRGGQIFPKWRWRNMWMVPNFFHGILSWSYAFNLEMIWPFMCSKIKFRHYLLTLLLSQLTLCMENESLQGVQILLCVQGLKLREGVIFKIAGGP